MTDKPDTTFAYAVQYQTEESKPGEWFEMTGRDHTQPYQHVADSGPAYETTSMEEALDTAEALYTRRAYPCDRMAYYYRPVIASRVITRVCTGHVSAVFGAPNVSRETESESRD